MHALLGEAEDAVKQARLTHDTLTEQRIQDREKRAEIAMNTTQAVEEDMERLRAEREELEVDLSKNLGKIRDLEVCTIAMGDYLLSAQRRKGEIEHLLKCGHPTHFRNDWVRMDIVDDEMRNTMRVMTGEEVGPEEIMMDNLQDVQDDLRAVQEHPELIVQDQMAFEAELHEAYQEKAHLEKQIADRRHASAITETLINLRQEGTSPALAAALAGQELR